MARQCKPGQRARVICSGSNHGKIVLVARHYVGEDLNGYWPEAVYPWVVVALGALLDSKRLDTGKPNPPARMIVLCDTDLKPLDDDDGEDETEEIDVPTPKRAPVRIE